MQKFHATQAFIGGGGTMYIDHCHSVKFIMLVVQTVLHVILSTQTPLACYDKLKLITGMLTFLSFSLCLSIKLHKNISNSIRTSLV